MWKDFDYTNPPSNWCFVKTGGNSLLILARWSKSHFSWIGFDLIPIIRFNEIDSYLETDYISLNDMIYNPRPRKS